MGLIEQAAKRLEELRRAGIEVPEAPAWPAAERPAPAAAPVQAAPRERRPAARVNIDLARLASLGFVTPDNPRSRIAEEFRVIKRPLLANATGKASAPVKHGNLIMVTSSVSAEGKTFASINLAMSIAMEVERTVLLVDGDVARPSLPRVLGIPESAGLLDVLADKSVDLGQVLLHTSVEKLSFLSSGRPYARAEEMLASASMTALLEELATRYSDRVVIFDTPPLLVTTEARALASRMGQIVFVVSAEQTPQGAVKQALATIEACPVKMTLLNKARTSLGVAYGYGYGYGYGG